MRAYHFGRNCCASRAPSCSACTAGSPSALAQLPEGSPERLTALANLRNIRRVLAHRHLAPH